MDYISTNQALWDSRVRHHYSSDFYDVQGFLNGASSLREIELSLLGDVDQKSIAHLQCHFGLDTLSLARMGAEVTGLDFSSVAIDKAVGLSQESGVSARFIKSDVYDAAKAIGGQVDMVFTSYGVIGWLPDLQRWAQTISDCLTPGGEVLLVEFHPLLWMYDNDFTKPTYSYFNSGTIIETEKGTYADTAADISLEAVTWNHSIGEVFTALCAAGLQVHHLREYDFSPYPIFRNNADMGAGRWGIEGYEGMLPLVYSLKAVKAVGQSLPY